MLIQLYIFRVWYAINYCGQLNNSAVDVVRRSLPESWRGLRDDELSRKSGIDGCIFVHASGFIAGNRTYDGALLMAQRALQL